MGGIREQIVDGETGLLVEPLDLEAFADAVVGLIGEPDDRARAWACGRVSRCASQFLGPRHLRQYVDLFEQLLSSTVQR